MTRLGFLKLSSFLIHFLLEQIELDEKSQAGCVKLLNKGIPSGKELSAMRLHVRSRSRVLAGGNDLFFKSLHHASDLFTTTKEGQ